MRVLWITNQFFKEYYDLTGAPSPATGGWMRALALELRRREPELEIAVASRDSRVKSVGRCESGGFTFFSLPGSVYTDGYDASVEACWAEVKRQFRPDVVHIHGSEYPHALAWVRACGGSRTAVSIQGLVSVYARYFTAGIADRELRRCLTFYDRFIASSPMKERKKYELRGRWERELIGSVGHVIGRTAWDRAHTWAINPEAVYHYGGETLRREFYTAPKWSAEACRRHRIFLSQAAKPIKGIHRLLEAMPLIRREFPDTEIYVAGGDFLRHDDMHSRLRFTTYGRYVEKLIKKHGLSGSVRFLGPLGAEEMAEQYRQANVFVCPSSIENSPNSLGEAQLIGCPVVASNVGGVADMVADGLTGLLYRFEETEMLAEAVCRMFGNDALAASLSAGGIRAASGRHDGDRNAREMLEIYKSIAESER